MELKIEKGLNYIFNQDTQVIIMGTFPSIKSRGVCYYNHPQNQFWKIIAEICHDKDIIEGTPDIRYTCLLKNGIGLWDVIQSCEFEKESSLDSKIIKDSIIYNDFSVLKSECPNLKCIVFSSKYAYKLYKTYLKTMTDTCIIDWLEDLTNNGKNILPSTSPANARKKPKEKLKEWKSFLTKYINE